MKVFVSYRSLDANLARAVVDRLRASGVDVWFAEYDVLSGNYEEFERRLPRSLDEAVAGCTHALVLTNDAWCQSGYCRHELVRILELIAEPERILEVRCPEHPPTREPPSLARGAHGDRDVDGLWCESRHCADRARSGRSESRDGAAAAWVCPRHRAPRTRFDALHRDPGLRFEGDSLTPSPADVQRLAEQVCARWSVSVAPLPAWSDPAAEPLELAGWGLRLQPGPFRLSMARTVELGGLSSDDAVTLVADVGGAQVEVFLFGSVVRSVLGWESEAHAASIEDRDLYASYRKFAEAWYRDPDGRQQGRTPAALRASYARLCERGLHVAFVQGQSLPAFTYTCGESPDDETWERRFLLPLRRADAGARGEVSLVFRVQSTGTPDARARRFHDLCVLFDAVAGSVEFDEALARPSVHQVAPACLALASWLVGLGLGLRHVLPADGRAWAAALLGAAAGWLMGQAVMLGASRDYRRLILQEVVGGRDRMQDVSVFETWSTELTRWLPGLPFLALQQLWVALTSPLPGLLTVAGAGALVAAHLVLDLPTAWTTAAAAGAGLGFAVMLARTYARHHAARRADVRTRAR